MGLTGYSVANKDTTAGFPASRMHEHNCHRRLLRRFYACSVKPEVMMAGFNPRTARPTIDMIPDVTDCSQDNLLVVKE